MSKTSGTAKKTLRILLVEDDEQTAGFIRTELGQKGIGCDVVATGPDALPALAEPQYDLAIIDRMLPGLDGLSVVRKAREYGYGLPVIFLTSVGGIDDRVDGLDAGGDDYLVKPFDINELLARVNALLRRAGNSAQTIMQVHDLEIDLINRTVKRGGREIELLPKEFLLLQILMENQGEVLTKAMLLEKVWNFHFDPKTSVVETHVSRLRGKIDRPFATQLLQTVRNNGYMIHAPR